MLIFDRDANLMKLGIQDKKGFKDYLDENGGMRVYRDGMRIFDYGEKENDWLNLDTRRINLPTKKISNNLIIGAIHLKREESQDLEEKLIVKVLLKMMHIKNCVCNLWVLK